MPLVIARQAVVDGPLLDLFDLAIGTRHCGGRGNGRIGRAGHSLARRGRRRPWSACALRSHATCSYGRERGRVLGPGPRGRSTCSRNTPRGSTRSRSRASEPPRLPRLRSRDPSSRSRRSSPQRGSSDMGHLRQTTACCVHAADTADCGPPRIPSS
jgi:hypothetical protein